jgi:hypothetical protein
LDFVALGLEFVASGLDFVAENLDFLAVDLQIRHGGEVSAPGASPAAHGFGPADAISKGIALIVSGRYTIHHGSAVARKDDKFSCGRGFIRPIATTLCSTQDCQLQSGLL